MPKPSSLKYSHLESDLFNTVVASFLIPELMKCWKMYFQQWKLKVKSNQIQSLIYNDQENNLKTKSGSA